MKFRNNNYKIKKYNKNIVQIQYGEQGFLLDKIKVIESADYEYWYEYEYNGSINGVNITSLNIRIGKVIYKNVSNITINNKIDIMGVHDGYCTIERVD